MNRGSEISHFNVRNCGENSPDFQAIEKTRTKALQRINFLYNDILNPVDDQYDKGNVANEEPSEISENLPREQSHYVKSCCTTLSELCLKCDQIISRCKSCNHCNCRNSYCVKIKRGSFPNSEKSFQQSSFKKIPQSPVKFTKPEPFSFVAKDNERQKAKEQKISKIKKSIDQQIESELKIRIQTKPVPKHTHLPLYSQIIQTKEKRKALRKEKCSEVINNSRSFELQFDNKHKEKSKSSCDLTALKSPSFKAKPVPKRILSNKVTEKLKNKEEIRKMLMAERAQQLKEQSSLPFSKRTLNRTTSLINVDEFAKTNNKDYSKKNISEITKRLYVIKCKDELNSWNEKVVKVTVGEKFKESTLSVEKSKLAKQDPMPFLFFPVRMSNAALLREKQNRERLTAKNTEEKMIETENDKKKMNYHLADKLRSLLIPTEGRKEITQKVKSHREWQFKRQEEYEKELQEIMMRVAEQSLLLERIPKKDKTLANEKPSQYKRMEDESEINESMPLYSEAFILKDESNKSTSPPSEADENDSASKSLNGKSFETQSSASEASSKQSISQEPSSDQLNEHVI